ncbi:hypothetical protein GCM10020221_15010 [Streptomyces thioluteus]|uniref:Uncharacterized protein n=1 Tax=Streptomyces thioluteus TaxID=66431 RepID=A0ABN3WKC3_STRTU
MRRAAEAASARPIACSAEGTPERKRASASCAAEAGEPGAVAADEAVSAGAAAVGVDGDARLGEGEDVPGDGALGDLQPPRQLGARHQRTGLEQQDQFDQAGPHACGPA